MKRKYEWNIIGHEKVIERLERDMENSNLASAYLFVGAKEIGKFCLAKTFAKILECGEEYYPQHKIAKEIEKNIFPDMISVGNLWQKDRLEDFNIISKSSNFNQSERKKKKMSTDTISIDDVHSFTSSLSEKTVSNYKICLIRDAHRMNNNSANAFLKTLEEPQEKTIFLLTANHEDLLPETVASRTRIIQMNLVPQSVMRKHLPEDNQEELLTLSQGRPARLKHFLEDPDFLIEEKTFFHEISNLLMNNDFSSRMKFAEKLSKENRKIYEFFDRFIHFLRSLLVEKVHNKNLPLSSRLSYAEINELISSVSLAKKRISSNVNKRLTLENLFLSFPQ